MSCGIKRILQFNDAVTLGPIKVVDTNNRGITLQCMYSWSSDMTCWTNWTNYATYIRIAKNLEEQMYLRVLLFDSFDRISLNGVFTKCYTICLDQSNPFMELLCNENTFNPYANIDCALNLQQQMADSIICMFGIPVYYFRVKPDATTADYTFKEYVLHNVVDVKQIKLMIPDGQMPSSNPKFTQLDFDWQVDWEVECGKTDFARAFGDTAFPKVRDFIYIPMMKRMWSVNGAYDEKNEGLMWRSTTWKLALVKYEDRANINATGILDEMIDNWTVNDYDDIFGRKEEIEQERQVGVSAVASPTRAATNLGSADKKVEDKPSSIRQASNLHNISMEDAVRQQYSKGEVSIIDYQYNHRSNIVARNIYRFKYPTSTITYQKGYCGSDGTLSFILQTQGAPVNGYDENMPALISMGPVKVEIEYVGKDGYIMHFNGMDVPLPEFTTQLVIIRWNKSTFSSSLEMYEYTNEQGIPKYMLRPEMYWFKDTPTVSKVAPYNNDFDIPACKKEDCRIMPYPAMVTNIKLYNKDLGPKESITESMKYTTQHTACVINDLARQMSTGHGYMVR